MILPLFLILACILFPAFLYMVGRSDFMTEGLARKVKMILPIFLIFACILFPFSLYMVYQSDLRKKGDKQETWDIEQLDGSNNFVCKYKRLVDYGKNEDIYYRILYAEEIIFIFIKPEGLIPEISKEKYRLAEKKYDPDKNEVRYFVPYTVVMPKYSLCINGEWLHVYAESLFHYSN